MVGAGRHLPGEGKGDGGVSGGGGKGRDGGVTEATKRNTHMPGHG